MKNKSMFACQVWFRLLQLGWAVVAIMPSVSNVHGQGTVLFSGQVGAYGTNYVEQGMGFDVIRPTGGTYDSMGIVPPNTYNNLAVNSTPYLDFFRQLNPDNYVVFRLTNGTAFGLASVDLADPLAPSLSPMPISFIGHFADGSSVTNTFTTPGGGATTFQSYTFNSDFASGLTSVDTIAPRWAMDNLVFAVPEPTTLSLTTLALTALILRRRRTVSHT